MKQICVSDARRPAHARSHATSRGRVAVATLLALLALLSVSVWPVPEARATENVSSERFDGENRYATAAAVAQATYPDGADTVLLASGLNFPDALSAGGLAGLLDAPILLTDPLTLPTETAQALADLGADTVLVLGGPVAVSDDVLRRIAVDDVGRIEGSNRYATAAQIAARLDGSIGTVGGRRTAVVATGQNFPDALALGPIAFRLGLPILLTRPDRVPAETVGALEDLGIEQVIIGGGTAVVDAGVERRLEDIVGAAAVRLDGANRSETAATVADFATRFLEFPGRSVVLADGGTFADAIAAGPWAGTVGAPVLLTEPTRLTEALTGYLLLNDAVIAEVVAVGGPVAVSEGVVDEAVATASSDPAAEVFNIDLSALNVVDNDGGLLAGQPEGVGTAVLKLSPAKRTIAFLLDAAVTPPFTGSTGARINRGGIEEPGSAVLTLATGEELQQADGGVTGFVREEAFDNRSVSIADILGDPQNYSVDVATRAYPDGAVRGQFPDGGQTDVATAVGDLTFTLDAAHTLRVEESTGAVTYGVSSEGGTAEMTLNFDLQTGTVAYRLDVSGIGGDLAGGSGASLREGFIDQTGGAEVLALASGSELAGAEGGVVEGTFGAGDFSDAFGDLSVREMFIAAGDFYVTVDTAENAPAVRAQLPDGGRLPGS